MFFILSKILFFLIQPLIWIILLLLLAIISKSALRRKRLIIGATLITLIFTNPFIFNEFSLQWEKLTPRFTDKTGSYDAAVVLGKVSGYDQHRQQFVFYNNAERLLEVLPLYYEGRVKKILLSGGSATLFTKEKEAEILKKYLLSINFPEEDILIEKRSRNTYENALYSLEVINENNLNGKILLSTSAEHMPRALACFHKLGKEVVPFPTDYKSQLDHRFSINKFLVPDPQYLIRWYWLIHEWVGLISYQLMGYC